MSSRHLIALLHWNSYRSLNWNIGTVLLRNVETFLDRHLYRYLVTSLLGCLTALSDWVGYSNLFGNLEILF